MRDRDWIVHENTWPYTEQLPPKPWQEVPSGSILALAMTEPLANDLPSETRASHFQDDEEWTVEAIRGRISFVFSTAAPSAAHLQFVHYGFIVLPVTTGGTPAVPASMNLSVAGYANYDWLFIDHFVSFNPSGILTERPGYNSFYEASIYAKARRRVMSGECVCLLVQNASDEDPTSELPLHFYPTLRVLGSKRM